MERRIGAVVRGKVQGVGFRFFTRERARCHGLTGWVRNREDGSVELEAQGGSGSIALFTAEMKEGPPLSQVSDMAISELPFEEGEKGFGIRH